MSEVAGSGPGPQLYISECFALMQDEEVVHLAKQGSVGATEFLIARFRPFVEGRAKAYYMIGADRDDVIQEGLIGLFKAIRDFRRDRRSSFRPFAELCISRQIITAIKTATRQKHLPLNGYVSLNQSHSNDASDCALIEWVPDSWQDPTCMFMSPSTLPSNIRETVRDVLSDLENGVLARYLDGMSYREIGRELDCRTKAIDNALQRVKKKIGVLLKGPLAPRQD